MSFQELGDRKALVRKQILADILEISVELRELKKILRMKQCLLRQTNRDIYRMSRASSYLDIIQGHQPPVARLFGTLSAMTENNESVNLVLIKGGRV